MDSCTAAYCVHRLHNFTRSCRLRDRLIGREQQDDDEAARRASSRSLRPPPNDRLDAPSPAMTSTAGGRSQELHNLSTAPLRPAADCASYGVLAFSCVACPCIFIQRSTAMIA